MSVLLFPGLGFSRSFRGGLRRRAFNRTIVTIFVRAMTKRTLLLGCLLQQKGRVALRAGFGDGFVPINAITFGIRAAAIKDLAAFRLLYYQFAFAAGSGTMNAGRFLLDIFTLRII